MKRLRKMVTFSGNAKRAKWLQFFLIALAAWLGAAFIDETYIAPNLCEINEDWICYLPGEVREGVTFDRIIAILLIVPFFAVTVRRLNSHQKSPFLAVLAVPLLALLGAFLYLPSVSISTLQLIIAAIISLPLFYWMLTSGKSEK